jgi:hypothetical protein
MEQQSRANAEHGPEGSTPEPDRYDNDLVPDQPLDAERDEYRVRLEKSRKRAGWRTEMALRHRNPGYRPSRPDCAF